MPSLLTVQEALSRMMCSAEGMKTICGNVLPESGAERSVTAATLPVSFARVHANILALSRRVTIKFYFFSNGKVLP